MTINDVQAMSMNENIFIQLENGEAIAWNYLTHEQFSIEEKYLVRLLEWSKGVPKDQSPIDKELIEANLVCPANNRKEEWGWDKLSHIFHKGTQDIPMTISDNPDEKTWISEYLDFCDDIIGEQPNLFTEHEGKLIDLDSPDFGLFKEYQLLESFRQRKTCRVFKSKPIPFKTLSTLLFTTFGQLHGDWSEMSANNLVMTGLRKASASGGGLHPEEAYVVALGVENLSSGLYHYRVQDNKLTLLREGDFESKVIELLYHQYFIKDISLGIFITARFDKAWWKYRHSRAYRNVLLDVGHVSQTFQLCATSLGYQTWVSGAFQDTAVNSFLGVDGNNESAIFFVSCGSGEMKAFDKKMLDQINHRRIVKNGSNL